MNCKPGDLAVVFKPGRTKTPIESALAQKLVGKIVEVRSLIFIDGVAIWTIDPFDMTFQVPQLWGWTSGFANVIGLSDDILKPLRDPGDDAVDEILCFHGKPTKQPEVVR